jgi:hypothetical protein
VEAASEALREARSRGPYEGDEGGDAIELRVDGTFASFYRPGSLLTGSV